MFKMDMIKNKKAQEESTLTWLVAVFVILFILVVFLFLTGAIAGKKKIDTTFNALSSPEKAVENTENDVFSGNKIFFALRWKDNNQKLLNSIDIYTTDSIVVNLLKRYNGDINKLDVFYYDLTNNNDFAVTENGKKSIANDKELFSSLKETLDPLCDDYLLKIPQGVIRKGNSGFVSEAVAMNPFNNNKELLSFWKDWTVIKISYKNNIIEIKYRELLKC